MEKSMKRHLRRRYVAGISLALAAVIATSGAVLAYWTVGGGGTGAAPAGDVANVTVVQESVLAPMYPGDALQELTGHFHNTNAGPVYLHQLSAAVTSVTETPAAEAANPGYTCSAADFQFSPATIDIDAEIASGDTAWDGIFIQFNNLAVNQDACKGATVNITYTVVP
jgi:hypothetical protein